MTTIFKFRSLTNKDEADRIENILSNEEFWFSPLWDQNDSIEAIYRPSEICSVQEPHITPYKIATRICSFSTKKGIYHPLMWALYASGFKGVAIELDPDPDPKIDIQEVIYRDNPTSVCRGKTIEDTVLGIMSSKSRIWEYESEVRLFIKTTNKMKGEGLAYKAGSIRSVILGKPYETISNISEIYDNSELLKSYKKRAREILEIAKSKGVSTKISYITISPTGPVVTIRECNDGDFDD